MSFDWTDKVDDERECTCEPTWRMCICGAIEKIELRRQDGEEVGQLQAVTEVDEDEEQVGGVDEQGAENGEGIEIVGNTDEVDAAYLDPESDLFGSLTFEQANPPESTWDQSNETRRAGIAFIWRNMTAFNNMDESLFHFEFGCEEGWCPCGA